MHRLFAHFEKHATRDRLQLISTALTANWVHGFVIQLPGPIPCRLKVAFPNRPNSNLVPRMASTKQTTPSIDEVRPVVSATVYQCS